MQSQHLGRSLLNVLQRQLAAPGTVGGQRQALARVDQRAVEGVVEQLGGALSRSDAGGVRSPARRASRGCSPARRAAPAASGARAPPPASRGARSARAARARATRQWPDRAAAPSRGPGSRAQREPPPTRAPSPSPCRRGTRRQTGSPVARGRIVVMRRSSVFGAMPRDVVASPGRFIRSASNIRSAADGTAGRIGGRPGFPSHATTSRASGPRRAPGQCTWRRRRAGLVACSAATHRAVRAGAAPAPGVTRIVRRS